MEQAARRRSRWRLRARGEQLNGVKLADLAQRAALDVDASNALPECLQGFGCGLRMGDWGSERDPGASQQRALAAIGEQAVMADAVEAARKHVQSESVQELERRELHRAATVAVDVVSVAKAD